MPPITSTTLVDEPPVVARLVVEIRSDGKRTIARGSFEEAQRGEHASITVEGTTPAQLALSLMRALLQMPAFAGSIVQTLLAGRSKNLTEPRGSEHGRPAAVEARSYRQRAARRTRASGKAGATPSRARSRRIEESSDSISSRSR
jgi:hypothetical protein